jgi:YVTN family beta-propeller protein
VLLLVICIIALRTIYHHLFILGIILGVVIFVSDILQYHISAQTLDTVVNETRALGGNIFPHFNVGQSPTAIAVNSDTNIVYVTNSRDDTVSVIDINNMKVSPIIVGHNPLAIAIDESTNTVYVVNSGPFGHRSSLQFGSLSVINGKNNMKLKDIPVGKYPSSIAVNSDRNLVYVVNSGSNTVSVINGTSNTKIKDIDVGTNPQHITVNEATNKVYVSNEYSNTVSVINGTSNTKIKDIDVGDHPHVIAIDHLTNTTYVVNAGYDVQHGSSTNAHFSTVSVINGTSNTKIKDIDVGDRASHIAVDEATNTVYVVNSGYGVDGSISIINGTSNTKIKDIDVFGIPGDIVIGISGRIYVTNAFPVILSHGNWLSGMVSVINSTTNNEIKPPILVEGHPIDLAINPDTDIVYVLGVGFENATPANARSGTVSAIYDVHTKLQSGVAFNLHPFLGGQIKCNNVDVPTNQYVYVDFLTQCIAEANKGFQFTSWIENLGHNSTRAIGSSTNSNSPLNSFLNIFGAGSTDTSINFIVTKSGNFTAVFEKLPPPLPAQFWVSLYLVIASSIVGWSIPSIIGGIKTKIQGRRVSKYYKDIDRLKSTKSIESRIDHLEERIRRAYESGKISEQHYNNLKNKISILYEEIYRKRIDSINGKNSNGISLDKIKDDVKEAYAKGNINEQHYDLLNEKISDSKTIDTLSSDPTSKSATQGSPIKI